MAATAALVDVPAVPALRLLRRFDRRNRFVAFCRLGPGQRLLRIAVAAAAVFAMVAAGYRFCADASWWLDPLRTHPAGVALAAALIVRSRLSRARRVTEQRFAQSWLAVAPIEVREVAAPVRRRVFAELIVMLGVATAVVGAAGVVNSVSTGSVIFAVFAGGIPGALAGWWSGGRPLRVRGHADGRIGHAYGARDGTFGLDSLGRWVFAERFSRLRPRIEARVFGSALLSMPMGIPPLIACLLLLSLVAIVVAATLLNAQLAIVPRAADWLRATPLALKDMAMASSARACFWQCIYTIAMCLLLMALGVEPRTIIRIAAGWLAWVAVSVSTAFACRHRPGRLRIELVALGALSIGLAAISVPIALIATPLVALVQWKRAQDA